MNPDMDRLLVKCLLQEATEAEREQMADWIAADPENERYFEDFRGIWEDCGRLAPGGPASGAGEPGEAFADGFGVRGGEERGSGEATGVGGVMDEEEAWERFRTGGRFPGRARGIEGWVAVAAALILFLAGGVTWWVIFGRAGSGGRGELLSLQTNGLVRTDTLPDGSLVTLNKYSSLQFPGQFGDHSRVVYLKGEGFFQVVNQVRQPFIVKMNGVTIRDLGTSFNVRAGNGETEVIVETGEVQVESGSYVVKAGAGEKVIVGLHPRKTAAADELYQYYRTKQFVCRNTPLGKLTEVLNEAYDVHIVVEGQDLRDLPLTATFRNESLDSVLSVVTRTFGLTLSRNGKEITLKQ